MAPTTNEGLKNTTTNNVKRFWNKILLKEALKNEKSGDFVVTDSVPDYFAPNEEEYSKEPEKNAQNEEENYNFRGETDEEMSHEKEGEWKPKTKQERSEEKKKGEPNAKYINIWSDRCSHIHIGDEHNVSYTQLINVKQNHNYGVGEKAGKEEKKEFKLTRKIEALLASNAKLGEDHIDELSKHFGKSYKEIGKLLKFSKGEIESFEVYFKGDPKEVSFEILKRWVMKKGPKATLGKLCKKLWESKIGNAKEAVAKMSEKMKLFN